MSKSRLKKSPDEFFLKTIRGSAAFLDICPDEQATIAGMAVATWYRRLKHPETFTVREFRKMIKQYGWNASTVCKILDISEDMR